MNYEVEQKFPVADLSAIEAKLVNLGADISEPRTEVDLYFSHPARDFGATDEALRIRRVGRVNRITYKGPKVDRTTKTRAEIELPLADGRPAFEAWKELLEVIGFTPFGEVRKSRRKAHLAWQNRRIEVSLDDVQQLGTFVELELVVDPKEYEEAKACIASLAETLGLSVSQRRSYLSLLTEG